MAGREAGLLRRRDRNVCRSRYQDCVAVATNPNVFCNGLAYYPPNPHQHIVTRVLDAEGHGDLVKVLIATDGPTHARVRSMLSMPFSPSRIAQMESAIDGIVLEQLAPLVSRGRAEAVSEFALPLPVNVIAHLFGIERASLGHLARWATAYVDIIYGRAKDPDDAERIGRDFADYQNFLTDLIAARRDASDNLVSQIIKARTPGHEPFSEPELLAIFVQLMNAGTVTTTDAITSMMVHLARHPGELSTLRSSAEPDLALRRYIEELLRMYPPQRGQPRVATEDTILAGVAIPKGANVFLSWHSANHDQAMFGRTADDFDAQRSNAQRHLAFGHGVHTCIGNALARVELKCVLRAFAQHIHALCFEHPETQLEIRPDLYLPQIARLPVRFDSARPNGAAR